MVTACSLAFDPGSSSFSLAARQLFHSACIWKLSRRVPFCASRSATTLASARSMLSPPSRMWSPTATRLSAQFAVALRNGDQGEVGSAAADIHHQNQIAHADTLAPVGMPLHPGVKRGLRLFEQGNILEAGLFGRFERQFARHRVEGGRHGRPAPAARRRARPASWRPMRGASAPDTGGWLRAARSSRRHRGRGTAAARPCGPRPECDSHDFADETSRPAFSTPRFCASRPTTNPLASSHGSARVPAGKSEGPGKYRNDGSRSSSRTSPGLTNCGMPIICTFAGANGSAFALISA